MFTPTWGVSGPRLWAGVGQVAGSGLDERRTDMEYEFVVRDVRYVIAANDATQALDDVENILQDSAFDWGQIEMKEA